jgi:hypothetical protein
LQASFKREGREGQIGASELQRERERRRNREGEGERRRERDKEKEGEREKEGVLSKLKVRPQFPLDRPKLNSPLEI